ncbi:MAG: helix-turn-helix domain-containing protein [Candidatus Verstraetearchaeota archaeon]|nr:helix-turn-helix domain-containing protein [Candidatus Verstraetearchaeota archaeon]
MVGLPPTPQELRILRKRAHLTQKELATKAGISQALVARIESGDVDPRVSTLRKILKVLNEVTETKFTMRNIMHQPVITVDVNETIGKAVEVMWKNGISQLPVMKGDNVAGSVREETILKKLKDENFKELLNMPILYLLEDPFPAVSIETDLDEVSKLLSMGSPAILVNEHGRMVGIITKIDLIAKQMM